MALPGQHQRWHLSTRTAILVSSLPMLPRIPDTVWLNSTMANCCITEEPQSMAGGYPKVSCMEWANCHLTLEKRKSSCNKTFGPYFIWTSYLNSHMLVVSDSLSLLTMSSLLSGRSCHGSFNLLQISAHMQARGSYLWSATILKI